MDLFQVYKRYSGWALRWDGDQSEWKLQLTNAVKKLGFLTEFKHTFDV